LIQVSAEAEKESIRASPSPKPKKLSLCPSTQQINIAVENQLNRLADIELEVN
jgi:hypothetical protein